MRGLQSVTTRAAVALAAAAVAVAAPADAAAQQRPPRRTQQIEIRGQVPTPQVVTVRPREVPAFSRQVLVPNFYDHDFWPAITPGYLVVPRRQITGNRALDSLTGAPMTQAARDSFGGAPAPDVARQREIQQLMEEFRARQARLDSIRLRADTLFQPGGVRRTPEEIRELQRIQNDARLRGTPADTTRRRVTPADTTRRTPADTTRRPPPAGTAPASRRR
jgi:hypothetical protein